MLVSAPAKINLGLNIIERRADGYHNLETVFYPVPLCDTLEVYEMDSRFPSPFCCDLKLTNIPVEGDEQRNLVVRAYQLLKHEFPTLPRLHAHLYKGIPTQAGMGGGSSDCANMLTLLNRMYCLGLSDDDLQQRAARLGADCAFFVRAQPSYAEGIGERLQPVGLSLKGWHLALVRPAIPVSTREAFSLIRPHRPARCCRDVVALPVEEWRDLLVNDFEASVFPLHPELQAVKERLYQQGAIYAAMSGSGSTLFGLFRESVDLSEYEKEAGCFAACLQL